jgi:hypothetical protein
VQIAASIQIESQPKTESASFANSFIATGIVTTYTGSQSGRAIQNLACTAGKLTKTQMTHTVRRSFAP